MLALSGCCHSLGVATSGGVGFSSVSASIGEQATSTNRGSANRQRMTDPPNLGEWSSRFASLRIVPVSDNAKLAEGLRALNSVNTTVKPALISVNNIRRKKELLAV